MKKVFIFLAVLSILCIVVVLDRLIQRKKEDSLRNTPDVSPDKALSSDSRFCEDPSDVDISVEDLPEPDTVNATLQKKQCGELDIDVPPHPWERNDYAVFFSTDTGDDLVFFVTEEEYLSVEEGTHGLLVYINERFLAFDTGENGSESE